MLSVPSRFPSQWHLLNEIRARGLPTLPLASPTSSASSSYSSSTVTAPPPEARDAPKASPGTDEGHGLVPTEEVSDINYSHWKNGGGGGGQSGLSSPSCSQYHCLRSRMSAACLNRIGYSLSHCPAPFHHSHRSHRPPLHHHAGCVRVGASPRRGRRPKSQGQIAARRHRRRRCPHSPRGRRQHR